MLFHFHTWKTSNWTSDRSWRVIILLSALLMTPLRIFRAIGWFHCTFLFIESCDCILYTIHAIYGISKICSEHSLIMFCSISVPNIKLFSFSIPDIRVQNILWTKIHSTILNCWNSEPTPTIICTRNTKVAAQLKSSRMLLALSRVYDGEDKEMQCKSTADRVAECFER